MRANSMLARLLPLILAPLLALPAFVLPTATAVAQELDPAHLALARKYVDLTDRAAIYEVTLVETGIDTMRTILQMNPGLTEQVDAAIIKTLDGYKGRKGDLLDQFARLYALRFTPGELEEMVAFYSTPTGEKLARVNSEMNSDLQLIMQVFQDNLQREFYSKVRAELKAAGYDV